MELPNEHNLAEFQEVMDSCKVINTKDSPPMRLLEDPEFCKWRMVKSHKCLHLQKFQAWFRSCFVDSHGTIHFKNQQHWTAVDLQTPEKKVVQDIRCVGGCKTFDRTGANACFEVKTCRSADSGQRPRKIFQRLMKLINSSISLLTNVVHRPQ